MKRWVTTMNTAKERLLKIIDEIPEREVDKILVFWD